MLQGSIVFSLHCAVFSSTCHKQGSHKEVAQNSILFCCTPCLSPRPSLMHPRVYFIWAGTACSISEYFIGMGFLVELWLSGSTHLSCQCVNDHFWWVSHFWYILSVPSIFKHADWLFYFTIHTINKFKKIKEATWALQHVLEPRSFQMLKQNLSIKLLKPEKRNYSLYSYSYCS